MLLERRVPTLWYPPFLFPRKCVVFMKSNVVSLLFFVTLCLNPMLARTSWALTQTQALEMASGEGDARVAAINAIVNTVVNAPDEKAVAFIQALADDSVKVAVGRAYIFKGDQFLDPVTGQTLPVVAGAEDVVNNNRMRGELDAALAAFKLRDPDATVRAQAVKNLEDSADESKLLLIESAIAREPDAAIKASLSMIRFKVLLNSADPAKRLESALALARSKSNNVEALLNERLKVEEDAKVKSALTEALTAIKSGQRVGNQVAALFTGISLGSILLLVALGLAITYGLMGVINMAHGELMMIGAYATFVVQVLFRKYLPDYFNAYLIVAVPVSFLVSALIGALLEKTVIRHLYGRPLETLLATWGISLILMQAVRTIFGAQNVGVENPSWMSGSLTILGDVTLPYNRLIIVAFSIAVLVGMALLIGKTRLGLFVRAVTQNRPIASSMGVHTARVDTYAFALGSGIAGLAGCALSQIGNVGPDLGQAYIVDSFMVVVLGGVGQLAGTVYAAFGLGIFNKYLEGWTGAVLAKIAVLIFIIVFIQKRPQGLFAVKGRNADA
jgi:urea transport system permease protein